MMSKQKVIEFLNSQMEKFTTNLRFREIDDSPYIYIISMDVFLNPCSNMCITQGAKDVILHRLAVLGIDERTVSFIPTKYGLAISAEKDGKQYWEEK